MVQKHIVISMIAPVAVAGILIMATMAAVSLTNQALAYNSYKSYKGHHGYYKSYRYTRHENVRASQRPKKMQRQFFICKYTHSEAEYNDYSIPPIIQTLKEIEQELSQQMFLNTF